MSLWEVERKIVQKCNANSTRGSQAVTHPSTNRARRCLTSVIGREPVLSTWYGRWRMKREHVMYFNPLSVHSTCIKSWLMDYCMQAIRTTAYWTNGAYCQHIISCTAATCTATYYLFNQHLICIFPSSLRILPNTLTLELQANSTSWLYSITEGHNGVPKCNRSYPLSFSCCKSWPRFESGWWW